MARLLPVAFGVAVAPALAAPWRLTPAIGTSWLRVSVEQRTRAEHLTPDFRAANPGAATALSLRTLAQVELTLRAAFVRAEVQDARSYASTTTPLNTTTTNPLDLLQWAVGARANGCLAAGDECSIALGRMTLDVGSRRLVARNEFRNTINAFSGVDVQWAGAKAETVRAFAVVPVRRLPESRTELADNALAADRELLGTLLAGLWLRSRPLPLAAQAEVYVIGLHEGGDDQPTLRRRLIAPGARLLRAPAKGQLHGQVEVIGQFGSARTNATADAAALRHHAYFGHASVGYVLDHRLGPQLTAQLDVAGGDRDPGDRVQQRFDTLFGARRFEYGPTGLYGAIARANVLSPALRLDLRPSKSADALFAYRRVWLAQARDAWTSAGLRDASGAAGRDVGHQAEARVRWQPLPQNLALEAGGALFLPGAMPRQTSSVGAEPSVYGYLQVTAWL